MPSTLQPLLKRKLADQRLTFDQVFAEAAMRQAAEDANERSMAEAEQRLAPPAPTPVDLFVDAWAIDRARLEAELLAELQRHRTSVTLKCVLPARLRHVRVHGLIHKDTDTC